MGRFAHLHVVLIDVQIQEVFDLAEDLRPRLGQFVDVIFSEVEN